MAETTNYKIISPNAESILIPLHSHFAVLADSVDKAIADRFQYKTLYFASDTDRINAYDSNGVHQTDSSKPNLVDGDVCYVNAGKRYYIWNVTTDRTSSWTPVLKRLEFDSIGNSGTTNVVHRDAFSVSDLVKGDTCFVKDIETEFYFDGAAWKSNPISSPKAIPTAQFYPPAVFGTSTMASIAGRILYTPFHVPVKGTYNGYNYNVTTGVASTSITIALFESSLTTGLPTTKITGTEGTGATTTTSSAVIIDLGSGVTLQPGWYWIGSFVLGGTPTLVTTGLDATKGGNWWMPKGNTATYNVNMSYPELRDSTNTGSVAGTMPSPAGTISYGETQRAPYISVRRSA